MKPLFSFNQTSFLHTHSVVLIKHTDLMVTITMIIGVVLVATLVIIFFTVEQQQKGSEVEEFDFGNNMARSGIESEINLAEPELDLGQSSSDQPEILEAHSQLINLPSETRHNLPKNHEEQAKGITEHHLTIPFPRLSSPMVPLETLRNEGQTENQKNGLKIACLVISVSTTGIVSFLVGFSGNQSSIRKKLLFKAVILSMCSSLFSALILLIVSTINLNFSCSMLTVRIIIWISTGLMTVGVVLLIAFYFHLP